MVNGHLKANQHSHQPLMNFSLELNSKKHVSTVELLQLVEKTSLKRTDLIDFNSPLSNLKMTNGFKEDATKMERNQR